MKPCGLRQTRWLSCFSVTVQLYNDISKESTMKVSCPQIQLVHFLHKFKRKENDSMNVLMLKL